jgi:hypothetical protein
VCVALSETDRRPSYFGVVNDELFYHPPKIWLHLTPIDPEAGGNAIRAQDFWFGTAIRFPSPAPEIRKIHVDSAAFTHLPSLYLRPESEGFAPMLRLSSAPETGGKQTENRGEIQ